MSETPNKYIHKCIFPKARTLNGVPIPDVCKICGKPFKELNVKGVKTRETIIDKYLKRAVEEAGGIIVKMHTVTNAGLPDRLIHCRGMTFYVELKTTGERPTNLQIEMHKRLKAQKIEVFVLDKKIENFYDIFTTAYTTYESKYYRRNPFKDETL